MWHTLCLTVLICQKQNLLNFLLTLNLLFLCFQQADNFCNSIGILQQFSTPSKFDRSGSQTPQQQQEGFSIIQS